MRTIIDIILVMMTINMMMVIIRMMMIIILCPPGQMHFFPSRLGLGLLEPAKAEFEVLFSTILPHLFNINLSLLFIINLSSRSIMSDNLTVWLNFFKTRFQLMVPVPNHDVTKNLRGHRMHVEDLGPP